MPEGFNNEPPFDPLHDTNPSQSVQPVDLNNEPPVAPDDTSPSKSQLMRAVSVDEPSISPDDTTPSLAMRPDGLIDPTTTPTIPAWRRVVGVLALLLAVMLTAFAVFLIVVPRPAPVAPPTATAASVAQQPTSTPPPPTSVPPTNAPVSDASAVSEALPTISAEQANVLLQLPVERQDDDTLGIVRNPYAPFTLIPDRPRSEVIPYTIEDGDTINSIAEKFGIEPESVVWGNSRDIIRVIRPGQMINIVPVDGVYIDKHVGNATLAEYAARYGIDDPYAIIDSEYNPQLRGLTPQSIPESGTPIMIAGGVAEQISWNPTVEREPGSSGGGGASGPGYITFAPGDPGSCGRVLNPGGGASWTSPLTNYTWMRGFTSFHTGVDLAASPGTPIYAARSGRVIFAGWNSYGYGYTVVLAHGPFTSLYGHMSSINVGCGQDVAAGQVIGGVGNTGNSSGPHLHFEIRYNDQPQDPTISMAF